MTEDVVLPRLGDLDPFGDEISPDSASPAFPFGVCDGDQDRGVIFNSCI